MWISPNRRVTNKTIALLLVSLCACDQASSQETDGTIKGKIEIPAVVLPQYAQHPMEYGGSMAPETSKQSSKEAAPEVTNVVVYLQGAGLARIERSQRTAVLDQRNATFIPHVLPIIKGTTVRIVNRDKTYHNVFSLSPVKRFDIGRRPTGEEVPVTFDRTGIVQVFCDIHSHMTAFIVVLANPMFVQPNNDGTFTLEDVPPGTYTIQAWHEHFSAPPQSVTVTAGGTSTVDFALH